MEQNEGKNTRPLSLRFLCILTFIGSGLSAFSYFVFSLGLDTIRKIIDPSEVAFLKSDEDRALLEMMLGLPRYYFILHFLLYGASFMGAYLMWNLRKTGFHLYAISQISLLILYEIFVPDAQFPLFPLLITAFFILLYSGHLRYMK